MTTTHFDFNGKVTATLVATLADTRHFLEEFEYYQTDVLTPASQHIDITLDNIPASARSRGRVVNKKFHVADDSIYAADSYKVARWETLIEGIDADRTKVTLSGNRFARLVWTRWFFETIVRLKFNRLGYSMVHSSSVCTKDQGFVLAASPSTGKTTMLLDWLGRGRPFCNDEYSIFNEDTLFSYVTPFRFHAHNLAPGQEFVDRMNASDKAQIRARSALLKATLGYADVTWKTAMQRVFPETEILSEVPLKGIFAMTKADNQDVEFRDVGLEEMAIKLSALNEFEWFGFGPYLRAFAYANPDSSLAERVEAEKATFRTHLKDRRFGEIVVPKRLDQRSLDKIYDFLGVGL